MQIYFDNNNIKIINNEWINDFENINAYYITLNTQEMKFILFEKFENDKENMMTKKNIKIKKKSNVINFKKFITLLI